MADDLNMDTVVELVRAAGFYAYVEQTGGGTATIYASSTPDAYGSVFVSGTPEDPRAEVSAGPGWFNGPGRLDNPRASVLEFSIGADDDGLSKPDFAVEGDTEESLANIIIRRLRAHTSQGNPNLTAHP